MMLATPAATPGGWRRYSPRLDDGGATYAALRGAISVPPADVPGALERIAREASGSGASALRVRAAALLLRDLVRMGWEYRADGHWIFVRPPTVRGGWSKEAIRRQLEFGRADQLREPATRRFIIGLERPTRFSRCRPVTDLIADGRRLAAQLAPIAALPRPARLGPLKDVCRPYLQLVDPAPRDAALGWTTQGLLEVVSRGEASE